MVDTSSRFRAEPDVPLVIAAVNPQALDEFRERRIAATPAPEVVQLPSALEPLRAAAGVERLHVTTLLPVSRCGRAGLEELAAQAAALLNGQPIETGVFPVQIAFNVAPDIEDLDASGYTGWERQLADEARRVWGLTTCRYRRALATVSGFHGCLQDVYLVPGRALSQDAARRLLATRPGLHVLDERDREIPNPVEAVGRKGILGWPDSRIGGRTGCPGPVGGGRQHPAGGGGECCPGCRIGGKRVSVSYSYLCFVKIITTISP
ncbi:MAG: hypothetical protein MZW92_29160 [Comamonadaceae bacterium]|nr:hypothetical protein [Comamonadaceae bacterium]